MQTNGGADACNTQRLVILLLLCVIPATLQYKRIDHREKQTITHRKQYIIYELQGEVRKPGIYRYEKKQTPAALAKACGARYNTSHNAERTIPGGMRLLFNQTETVFSDMEAAVLLSYFQPISLETASAEDLEMIPGIGPKTARALFDYIKQAGPVSSIDNLINVRGIGPKTLKKIKRYLRP